MKPKPKFGTVLIGILDVILLALCLIQIIHPIFHLTNYGVFNAKGPTAQAQARLIKEAAALLLSVALPILAAAFFVAFKYRADKNQTYDPSWGNRHSRLQFLWWAFAILVIGLLSIINFRTAHTLDPFNAIASPNPPLTIQVVALQWKWLFIYPSQNIATVNYIDVPVNTPVHFELTADGPMSLFWVPQLGGEMAAMAAMNNQINLMATQTGSFTGQNSEINGAGYDHMKFTVNSVSRADFGSWTESVKQSSPTLTQSAYNNLAAPSYDTPEASFGSTVPNLYNNIMMKYMMPAAPKTIQSGPSSTPASDMPGMEMK